MRVIPLLSSAVLFGLALAAPTSDPASDPVADDALAQFQQLTAEAQAAQAELLDTASTSSKRANTCTWDKLIVRKPWYVTRLTSSGPQFQLAVPGRRDFLTNWPPPWRLGAL